MANFSRVAKGRVPIGSAVHGTVHAVQFYETDDYLLETLAAFVAAGLRTGEAAIVVATAEHCARLDERLLALGCDVERSREDGAYVSLDAAETLARFRDDGTLDGARFNEIIGGAVTRARGDGATRPVRVFGEMVALLWAEGDPEGALVLENLWNELSRRTAFALLCAYPVSLFADDSPTPTLSDVIVAHQPGVPRQN